MTYKEDETFVTSSDSFVRGSCRLYATFSSAITKKKIFPSPRQSVLINILTTLSDKGLNTSSPLQLGRSQKPLKKSVEHCLLARRP